MLTEEQIDYVLQIKDTEPPLSEGTIRTMLGALRWTPEEVDHALAFIKRAPVSPEEAAKKASVHTVADHDEHKPELPVVFKQHPFVFGYHRHRNHGKPVPEPGTPHSHTAFFVGVALAFIVLIFVVAFLAQ